MPSYLRFVQGLIDSNDLPLNVSREILQDNHVTKTMRTGITKRVLACWENWRKTMRKKYQQFWAEFGQVLKEGPAEDFCQPRTYRWLITFCLDPYGQCCADCVTR